jgi:PPE-repeat protein
MAALRRESLEREVGSGSQASQGFVRHRFCGEGGRLGRREAAVGEVGVVAVDFGALPPEINSGRMYAGAGSGSLVAAAAAWEGLASELGSAATSYRAVVADLTGGPWVGPSSLSMAAAAAPYVAWMSTTAAQAEQTASQLGLAIAAYEAAFAATVAPPVIAANRALLAVLVATNILGQNTPAIAATEAQYAEMWAQDAGAMYGYAGASAAATTVTPFNPPPQTTNPAGTGTQAAALTHAAASPAGAAQNLLAQVPAALQSLAAVQSFASQGLPDAATRAIVSVLNSPPSVAVKNLLGQVGIDSIYYYGAMIDVAGGINMLSPLFTAHLPAAAAAAVPALAAPAVAAPKAGVGGLAGSLGGGAGVSAGLGKAATVGGLAVPRSWAMASPAIRLAATALPAAGLDGWPQPGAAGLGGWPGGMPMVGGVVNASRNGAGGPRPESRLKVIPQIAVAPVVNEGTPDRGMTATGRAADAVDALSERERYELHELHELREELAELAMERDAAARLIEEVIRR